MTHPGDNTPPENLVEYSITTESGFRIAGLTRPADTTPRPLVKSIAATNADATLSMPDVEGLSLHHAALAYGKAGWFVLPTDPGDIKNPGSVVRCKWQEQSSRDPEQINKWWDHNPNYGIALHIGRSGAVGFDLDAEKLDVVRPDIAEALRSAKAVMGTRREGDRGHYIFVCADGESFSNSAGDFAVLG